MFLTDTPNKIPDFLQALGFIAPKGFNISYFLTPESISDDTINDLKTAGFSDSKMPIDSGTNADNGTQPQQQIATTNVRYLKRDPIQSHSFSSPMIDPTDPNNLPKEMPKTMPTQIESHNLNPIMTDGGNIKSPFKAIQVVESTNTDMTLLLREDCAGLPRNTLIFMERA
jgi:hypothetical protein